jgi:hypothetical protein
MMHILVKGEKKRKIWGFYSGLLMSFVLETMTPSFLWGFLMTASIPF